RGNAVDVIAVDTIAALLPRDLIDAGSYYGEKNERHHDRLAYHLRSLLGPLSQSRAVLLFTNRVVLKIGVFFGSPETIPDETTPTREYASLCLELRRGALIKKGDEVIGTELKAKVMKNRFATPSRQATFELLYEGGISRAGDVLNMAIEDKLVEKKSST